MSAFPGDIDTDQQPPMTVPLRHFVVAFGLLVVGVAVAIGDALGVLPGLATRAQIHLLLAGWVCVTIMGAMTQFVPVWSATGLHSRRLASVQLWLVLVGVLGAAASFLATAFLALAASGAVMLLGFWAFAYNVGRTLAGCPDYDVTERHFILVLAYLVVLTSFGLVLAVDYTVPIVDSLPVARANLLAAHATLAVFGVILTTVIGALYQLATMFTQTELHGVDHHLRRFEEVAYPAGVVLLAVGRLVGSQAVGRVGAIAIVASLLGFSVVLGRRLVETQVEWTPMLSRYAVAVPAMAAWALLTAPAWVRAPTDGATLFGGPGTSHLLTVGVVGFVVFGTLYHVVPFIVWVHRYSDLVGLEDVPMIDDLYDDRLAAADFGLLVVGTALLVVGDWVGSPVVFAAAGVLVAAGSVAFSANLLLVIRDHSPHTLAGVLLDRFAAGDGTESAEERTA